MIPKDILDQAKAFLCWDRFHDVTIKLIPLKGAVAFHQPPSNLYHTIFVFYPASTDDFSHALFLLFHEAGHLLQFEDYQQRGQEEQYWNLIQAVNGTDKGIFELEAWRLGGELLQQFQQRYDISGETLFLEYDNYAEQCVKSYTLPEDGRERC